MKKILTTLLFMAAISTSPLANAETTEVQQNAIVKIYTIDRQIENWDQLEEAKVLSSGSGVIITEARNRVLTNYHVVKDYDENPEEYMLIVCVTLSAKEPPTCIFTATVERGDEHIDVATILMDKAHDYETSNELIPFETFVQKYKISDLPYIMISHHLSASELDLGEDISVIGYPAAGGSTITLTKGIVSGFYSVELEDSPFILFIKTDAKVNPGNSGGAVFDEENNFIGMPTFVTGGEGNIGYILTTQAISKFLLYTEKPLSEKLLAMQNEYEDWLAKQCTEHAIFTDGECVCEEGYEAMKEDGELQCVETVVPEEIVPEEEDELTEEPQQKECDENAVLVSKECVCEEGYVLMEEGVCSLENMTPPFSDVSATHSNSEAIFYLQGKNILSGYADGRFRPRKPVNRAELLKILIEANPRGYAPQNNDKNCFSDVKTGEWFTPYVCYAKEQKWVTGYSDETFRPAQTVSKAEAVKMVFEAYGLSVPITASESYFSDINVFDWYAPYLQYAYESGFLEEVSGIYGPDTGMSRAGISELIYRVLTY